MSDTKYVLEATEITKTFPGVKALDKVSLRVRPGTVHALMGENGAGKSTLMKCIYGIYSPDEGSIRVGGEETQIHNPRMAMDLGISMIHQELHPVRPQTVAENIFLGRIPYKKAAGIRWVDKEKLVNDTQKVFDRLGLDIDPKQKVEELSTSYCQLIEIARAVSFGAKIIIMDEPTSSLTETETEILFRIIKQLKEENVAIIYISHKIDEILQISDEITIMRDGQLVGTWPAEEMTTDLIVSRMVGREMNDRFPPKSHKPMEEELLRSRAVSKGRPGPTRHKCGRNEAALRLPGADNDCCQLLFWRLLKQGPRCYPLPRPRSPRRNLYAPMIRAQRRGEGDCERGMLPGPDGTGTAAPPGYLLEAWGGGRKSRCAGQ